MSDKFIFTITQGFFIMGEKGSHPNPDWITIKNPAISGGYGGGKGIGGIASGESQDIKWDFCPDDIEVPVNSVVMIIHATDKMKTTNRDGKTRKQVFGK